MRTPAVTLRTTLAAVTLCVVLSSIAAAQKVRGFAIVDSTFQELTYKCACGTIETEAIPTGINNSRTIVGAYGVGDFFVKHSFLLQQGVYSEIHYPNATQTWAKAINNNDQVVGYYSPDDEASLHGFLLDKGAYTTFDYPGVGGSVLSSINDWGDIVGSYLDLNGKVQSFVYKEEQWVDIAIVGAVEVYVTGINNMGEIVGDYSDVEGRSIGFLIDREGAYSFFEVPGAVRTYVGGVNNLGHIAGSYMPENGRMHGFVKVAGDYRTVDNPDPRFDTAILGINDLGDLVGSGQVAEPSSLLTLAPALGILALRRRRR